MKQVSHFRLPGLALLICALGLGLIQLQSAHAQGPLSLPTDQPSRGLIYRGMQSPAEGPCKGFYAMNVVAGGKTTVVCTPGPDMGPEDLDVRQVRLPLAASAVVTPTSIQCDGDGVSGPRVQILYAHASDVPDHFSKVSATLQQIVADADSIFDRSAAETGGSRHIRFVHDATCHPTLVDVTLSPGGDDDMTSMFTELWAQGFNLPNRDYMVFVDANVYCGVSGIGADDQPGPGNANNGGPAYSRIDVGCWNGKVAAHELMHSLGGVQPSAPHSDGAAHCTDGYDRMCDATGSSAFKLACRDWAYDGLFDCNHDDYYSTNPPPNSYLATHWNVANSIFLIASENVPSLSIDSLTTGKLAGNLFQATDTFARGNNIVIRVQLASRNGANMEGAHVQLLVKNPKRRVRCTLNATTDAEGRAQVLCPIPRTGATGAWVVQISSVTPSPNVPIAPASILAHRITVK